MTGLEVLPSIVSHINVKFEFNCQAQNFIAKSVKTPKMPNCQTKIFTAKRLSKLPNWHLEMSV